MAKKLFVRRFENNTFESVFCKSVEIESVVVSAHPFSFLQGAGRWWPRESALFEFHTSLSKVLTLCLCVKSQATLPFRSSEI